MIEPTMAGIKQALNHRSLSQFEQWWLVEQVERLREWQELAVPFLQDGIDACVRDGEDCEQCDTAKRLLADRQS